MMTAPPIAADLAGRVAVVTGANRGMGKETARALAHAGADVVLACRSADRGAAAAAEIRHAADGAHVTVLRLDLSSPASVRTFAAHCTERFASLDVLVHNAAASLRAREVTAEGFEAHWATNVLGPYLLTTLLLPALRAGRGGRIVDVSTRAAGGLDLADPQYERRAYRGVAAYRASKQAGRMLTWALAAELAGTTVTANAVNPGYAMTELTRNVTGPMKLLIGLTSFAAKSPAEAADTAVWAAASPDTEALTGRFWSKRREIRCRFRDPARIGRLEALVRSQITDVAVPLTPVRPRVEKPSDVPILPG